MQFSFYPYSIDTFNFKKKSTLDSNNNGDHINPFFLNFKLFNKSLDQWKNLQTDPKRLFSKKSVPQREN